MKFFANSLTIAYTLSFIIIGCNTHEKTKIGSPIDLNTAVAFRQNYVYYPSLDYHIPSAFMFETEEFDALLNGMEGIDKVRFYPAINTHDDTNPDSLTLIMVPVNQKSGSDNLTKYLFEFCQMCPPNCSSSGVYPAPIQDSLKLNIPNSWCITKDKIAEIIKAGEDIVGSGNVYGIRMYWYENTNGIMDLDLKPTSIVGDFITDIQEVSFRNITEICLEGSGCCDPQSQLYNIVKSTK